jgi:hypothetical protein
MKFRVFYLKLSRSRVIFLDVGVTDYILL